MAHVAVFRAQRLIHPRRSLVLENIGCPWGITFSSGSSQSNLHPRNLTFCSNTGSCTSLQTATTEGGSPGGVCPGMHVAVSRGYSVKRACNVSQRAKCPDL